MGISGDSAGENLAAAVTQQVCFVFENATLKCLFQHENINENILIYWRLEIHREHIREH